jgi:hypothetical protein|eukprot:COSAG02_NODE_36_length_48934_cov_144.851029_3_plen_61_part_00
MLLMHGMYVCLCAASDWEGGYRVEAFVHSPLLPAQVAGTTWDGIAHSSVRVPPKTSRACM